jgi:uncharacterized protein (TIGR02466 family)
LFPTPVLVFRWPDAERFKSKIVEAVRLRQNTPGVVRSNRNAWHSEIDLPAWPEPALQALTRWTAGCAEQASLDRYQGVEQVLFSPWRMNGWANVNPPGGFNRSHHHVGRNWHWSAVYYVELGDIPLARDSGGALVFAEKGMGLQPKGAPHRTYRLDPNEGDLVIFPSWLYHEVEAHNTRDDRISIAFNLHNKALERSRLWEHRPKWLWRTWPSAMRRIASWRGAPDESQNAVPPGVDMVP